MSAALTPPQVAVLDHLAENGTTGQNALVRITGIGTVRALLSRGLIVEVGMDDRRQPLFALPPAPDETPEQAEARHDECRAHGAAVEADLDASDRAAWDAERASIEAESAPDCAACHDEGLIVTREPVGDGTVTHVDGCDCPAGERYAERAELQTILRALRFYRPDVTDSAEHGRRLAAISRISRRLDEVN